MNKKQKQDLYLLVEEKLYNAGVHDLSFDYEAIEDCTPFKRLIYSIGWTNTIWESDKIPNYDALLTITGSKTASQKDNENIFRLLLKDNKIVAILFCEYFHKNDHKFLNKIDNIVPFSKTFKVNNNIVLNKGNIISL